MGKIGTREIGFSGKSRSRLAWSSGANRYYYYTVTVTVTVAIMITVTVKLAVCLRDHVPVPVVVAVTITITPAKPHTHTHIRTRACAKHGTETACKIEDLAPACRIAQPSVRHHASAAAAAAPPLSAQADASAATVAATSGPNSPTRKVSAVVAPPCTLEASDTGCKLPPCGGRPGLSAVSVHKAPGLSSALISTPSRDIWRNSRTCHVDAPGTMIVSKLACNIAKVVGRDLTAGIHSGARPSQPRQRLAEARGTNRSKRETQDVGIREGGSARTTAPSILFPTPSTPAHAQP